MYTLFMKPGGTEVPVTHRSRESCTSYAVLGAFGAITNPILPAPWIAIGVRRGQGRRSLSRSSQASPPQPPMHYQGVLSEIACPPPCRSQPRLSSEDV